MKKLSLSTIATALVATSLSPLTVAPAFAATVTPTADTQAAMQSSCDASKPADTNGVTYVATPDITNTVTETIETNRVTIEDIPSGILLGQTPFAFTTGSEHRNGYSANIHGDFTSEATYSGGKLVQEVTEVTNTTFTFGCKVVKTTRGQTNLAPPGQQVPATLTKTQIDATITRREEVSAPNVTVTLHAEKVICISPKKNPGTWTNQNGYSGTCSTALYNAVALGGPVPSNSVPGVSQLLPSAPDHQTALPEDQLYYPQLPNDPEDFLTEA